jgi:hypothetical protein
MKQKSELKTIQLQVFAISPSVIACTFIVILFIFSSAVETRGQEYYFGGDYEIYSLATPEKTQADKQKQKLFTLTARNSLTQDGLGGFFVGNTADRLKSKRLIMSSRYIYHKLSSRRGQSYYATESGEVSSYETTLNWAADWAEWAVTIPFHDYSLGAPKTYSTRTSSNAGLGNMRLGWKATYLPDKSYYRFAYGVLATVTTGNPERLLPAGSKNSDELKVFGCVTTKETDRATANLELGAVIDSESEDDRFLYRGGMSYEATDHVSLIGELAGEILGGDDKDSLDLVLGMRFGISETWNLELAYFKNLRTHREYGWDDQFQAGYSIRW